MDGGIGPHGSPSRDLREFIPGKNKTVVLEGHPAGGIIGGLFFGVPGMLLWWIAFGEFQKFLLKQDATGLGWTVVLGLFGSILLFPLVLMLYVAFDSWRCLALYDLCDRLNVSENVLRQFIKENGIGARYVVEGIRVYRLGEFKVLRVSNPLPPTP
jgi:hypothetical protein